MSARLKFFSIHLLLSLFIIFLVFIFIFIFWYPSPLAEAVGVKNIMFIVICIDIIVGPILALIIYNEFKKRLKMELMVIFIIQIFALIWGVVTIFQGRPIWIAYNVDRFELVCNNEIIVNNQLNILPQFKSNPIFSQKFVGVELAKDPQIRSEEMFQEVFSGISIAQKPEHYVDIMKVKNQIKDRAINLKQLKNFNDQKQLSLILSKYPQANAYLPLKARKLDMTILINSGRGEVIAIVNLRPW